VNWLRREGDLVGIGATKTYVRCEAFEFKTLPRPSRSLNLPDQISKNTESKDQLNRIGSEPLYRKIILPKDFDRKDI
jgi:hypothetical protein